MKVSDIVKRPLLINEIFDTKVPVEWREIPSGYRGSFQLDGHEYQIQIDEFEIDLSEKYSYVDFGFTRDGGWDATHDTKSASKIFSIILNAFIDKVSYINPSFVMFGVNYLNGSVESRKSLYDRLARYFGKAYGYHVLYSWVKGSKGEYCLMTKEKLSEEDKIKLDSTVANIIKKPIA